MAHVCLLVYPSTRLTPEFFSPDISDRGELLALRGDLALSLRSIVASKVLHRPQTGHDVVLTLDAELQAFAAEQLGDREGAVVVLDVESGAVRAMVSLPTFDPAALDRGNSTVDDPAQPLFNRATQGLYSPGSTWKAVTIAAALDSGQTRLDEVVEDGEAVEYFSGFPVRCNNNPEGTNRFDIAHAFGWSCNVTFARMGSRLGASSFRAYTERFGLGDSPPFPFPVAEASLSSDDAFEETELVSAAFGQGEILVTPLHMALIAAAIAGDGDLPVPYLLDEVLGVRWNAIADERGSWKKGVPANSAALHASLSLRSMIFAQSPVGSSNSRTVWPTDANPGLASTRRTSPPYRVPWASFNQ